MNPITEAFQNLTHLLSRHVLVTLITAALIIGIGLVQMALCELSHTTDGDK